MCVRKQALFSIETGSPFSSEVAGPRSQTFTAGCEREVGGEMRPLFFFGPRENLQKGPLGRRVVFLPILGRKLFLARGLPCCPRSLWGPGALTSGLSRPSGSTENGLGAAFVDPPLRGIQKTWRAGRGKNATKAPKPFYKISAGRGR